MMHQYLLRKRKFAESSQVDVAENIAEESGDIESIMSEEAPTDAVVISFVPRSSKNIEEWKDNYKQLWGGDIDFV